MKVWDLSYIWDSRFELTASSELQSNKFSPKVESFKVELKSREILNMCCSIYFEELTFQQELHCSVLSWNTWSTHYSSLQSTITDIQASKTCPVYWTEWLVFSWIFMIVSHKPNRTHLPIWKPANHFPGYQSFTSYSSFVSASFVAELCGLRGQNLIENW